MNEPGSSARFEHHPLALKRIFFFFACASTEFVFID
jgi:hypothetical protein